MPPRLELRNLDANLGRELLTTFVARDHAITEHDDASGMRRDVWLVRDHHHGLAFARELLEYLASPAGRKAFLDRGFAAP